MDANAWAAVRDALDDLAFPATKEEIVGHADGRDSSRAVVPLLRALPVITYRGMSDVYSSLPLDPAAMEGQTDDLKARQARSRHSNQIAEHMREPDQ